MKIRHCCFVTLLIAAVIQPVSAMCMGNLLQFYLQHPHEVTAPGAALSNSQLALVKIVAIRPDSHPRSPWKETGTLELRKIESNGKSLPATFAVPYHRRFGEGIDCETWDFIVLKPGGRLLAFVRTENKGWSVPELGAGGIVSNVERMDPALRTKVQRLFRARL